MEKQTEMIKLYIKDIYHFIQSVVETIKLVAPVAKSYWDVDVGRRVFWRLG